MRARAVLAWIAAWAGFLAPAGCRSAPVLPGEPGYVEVQARATAGLAVEEDPEDRSERVLALLDAKAGEIAALEEIGGPRVPALCRAYVRVLEKGLLPLLEQAMERGAPPRAAIDSVIPRLEGQREILETLEGNLGSQGVGEVLEALRRALRALAARQDGAGGSRAAGVRPGEGAAPAGPPGPQTVLSDGALSLGEGSPRGR